MKLYACFYVKWKNANFVLRQYYTSSLTSSNVGTQEIIE